MDIEASTINLFCFQHCIKDANIFCLTLPKFCPICNDDIEDSCLLIPLYKLPNPFSDSKNNPHSLLVKPTRGDFLHDYSFEEDLHVGVTNSICHVYHFNRHGLQSVEGWNGCVSVDIFSLLPQKERSEIIGLWDCKLWEALMSNQWDAKSYHETGNNCYDFVLSFLGSLQIDKFLPCVNDKTTFCEQVIMKNIRRAIGFIKIYRNLRLKNVYWINNRDDDDNVPNKT